MIKLKDTTIGLHPVGKYNSETTTIIVEGVSEAFPFALHLTAEYDQPGNRFMPTAVLAHGNRQEAHLKAIKAQWSTIADQITCQHIPVSFFHRRFQIGPWHLDPRVTCRQHSTIIRAYNPGGERHGIIILVPTDNPGEGFYATSPDGHDCPLDSLIMNSPPGQDVKWGELLEDWEVYPITEKGEQPVETLRLIDTLDYEREDPDTSAAVTRHSSHQEEGIARELEDCALAPDSPSADTIDIPLSLYSALEGLIDVDPCIPNYEQDLYTMLLSYIPRTGTLSETDLETFTVRHSALKDFLSAFAQHTDIFHS